MTLIQNNSISSQNLEKVESNQYKSDVMDQQIQSEFQTLISSNELSYQAKLRMLVDQPEYDDFEIDKQFFGGAMGKTFLVRHKPSSLLFVMKRVDYLDEKDKKLADDEIAQMRKLTSKYTVRLIWTFVDRVDLYIVSEYCSKGDLRKHIAELQNLHESERISYVWELFSQIVLGINYIHSMGIIHRDIKPENIFLMADGTVRIGDFGLAKQLLDKDYYAKAQGTKFYFAPEIYIEGKMRFESDVYSVGVVIFELLTGKHPFATGNEQETIDNIKQGKIMVQFPQFVTQDLKEIVMKMLNSDYKKRPTMNQLMNVQIINKNIQIFEEKYKNNEDKIVKELKIIQLTNIKQISLDQLKSINEEINNFKDLKQLRLDQFNSLSNALCAIRSIEAQQQNSVQQEMNKMIEEIKNCITQIIKSKIEQQNAIQYALQSGLILELIDLASRSLNENISQILEILNNICEISSGHQTHKMFEMGIFQALNLTLNHHPNNNIHQLILKTFYQIALKGWKHAQALQQQAQQSSQASLSQQQTIQFTSTEITQSITLSSSSSSSSSSIEQISSFETLPSNLQHLLLLPHPYLYSLEKQGIIQKIIENVFVNREKNMENKFLTCKLLDALYVEGASLPQNLQQQIISGLQQIAKLNKQMTYYKKQQKEKKENLKEINDEEDEEDEDNDEQSNKYLELDEEGKIDYEKMTFNEQQAINSISYLAMNNKNHEQIVGTNFIETSLKFYKVFSSGYDLGHDIIIQQLKTLQLIYIYGKVITKKLIHLDLNSEALDKMRKQRNFLDTAQILESTFANPKMMNMLMKIKRSIENKGEDYLIDVINAGLIEILKIWIDKIMEKQLKETDGEIVIIGQIIESLTKNNPKVSNAIIENTDFTQHNIQLLNSTPVDKIRHFHLSSLEFLSTHATNEQKKQLFSMGIIQTIVNMLETKDQKVIEKVQKIIQNIVEAGYIELKEGEKNPYLKTLSDDGTILKLIQIYQFNSDNNAKYWMAQTFSKLFKADALPPEVRIEIIERLKSGWRIDFDSIILLAQHPDNHNAILQNNFEKEFFKVDFLHFNNIFQSLNIINSIFKLGSDENKMKVAHSIKKKVNQISYEEYLDDLVDENNWNKNQKDEIRVKIKQILQMIQNITGEVYSDKNLERIIGEQKASLIQSTQPITLEQLQEIDKDFDNINNQKILTTDLAQKLCNGLRTIRTIQKKESGERKKEMKELKESISNYVSYISLRTLNNQNDIQLALLSGLIDELIIFIKRTEIDKIPSRLMDLFQKISEIGTEQHIYIIYEKELVQILISIINFQDEEIQLQIVQILINIAQKGWKQQLLAFSSQKSSSQQQTLHSPSAEIAQSISLSSSLSSSQSSSLSSSIESISTFETLPSDLQQLLLLPHPYLYNLEKKGVIRKIIEEIILNENVHTSVKLEIFKLFDILFIEGIQLPTDLRTKVISYFCEIAQARVQEIQEEQKSVEIVDIFQALMLGKLQKSQQQGENTELNENKQNTFGIISFLAINKQNHVDIISLDFIKASVEYIKNNYKKENIDTNIFINILIALQYIYIHGTEDIRKIIFREINSEEINIKKNDNNYNEQIMIFESIFANPKGMYILIQILRSIQYNREEFIIQLIRNGLIVVLEKFIDLVFQLRKEEIEGQIILISKIMKKLTDGNSIICNMIINETNFIDKLFKLFQIENIQSIHNYITIIIANVFKSRPLQPDLIEIVVRKLLLGNNLDEIVFLSECSENQNTIFAIITRDLQQNIQGSDEEKLLIQKLQDNEFKFLEKLLKDRKDFSLRKNAVNSGIIEALHYIFTTRDMDEITYPHFLAFFRFTWPYSAEMSRILVDKKSFDFLLRLLYHKNLNILNESINALVNIMYGGTLGLDENQIHPYYKDLSQVGGIEKIYSLFKSNISRKSKDCSAKCLGIAFKAQKIDDENMRKEIIKYLKSIIENDAGEIDDEVELALRCLAQNSDNHVEQ